MQNLYPRKLIIPLLLYVISIFPVSANRNHGDLAELYSPYIVGVPLLEARPSLVGAISLTWQPVTGATGYVLQMSNSGAANTFVDLQTFGPAVQSYRHADLYYNQKVYYRMKALASGTESAYSAVVSATTHKQGKVFNIMPLGDSNTEGGNKDLATDQKASYRAKLEQLLNASASKGLYDYVGDEKSGSAYVTDQDHAGYGAARNEDLLELLQNGSYTRWYDGRHMGLNYSAKYLEVFSPDVILLHTGTNDISNEGVDNSQTTANELEAILNEIDKYEQSSGKEVTVIVAKIIKTVCTSSFCYKGPDHSKNDIIDFYNQKVQAIVNQRIQKGDRLELVDMADANIIYQFSDSGGDMADPMHPILAGYNKMAPVWFKVLDKLLNVQPQLPPDTQAPETSITSKPASITNSKSAAFGFSSNEQNVTYLVSLDGGAFTQVTNPYTTANLADGSHTLQVKAKDAAGNIDDTPASYTWTIDTKAPAAPVISSPAENAILNTGKPTISGTAEANSVVTVWNGSSQLGTTTASASGNWTFTPASNLTDGEHQITAKATDAAGNISAVSATRNFTTDGMPPETSITAAPATLTNQSTAEFTFTSNEAGVKYKVSLDGATYVEVANPYTLSGLSEGQHTLAVKAVDQAGNTDASPATHTWTIDTQPPAAPSILSITEDKGPDDADKITSDNTLLVSGTSEANAKVEVYLKGNAVGQTNANAAGEWTFDYTGTALAAGTHTFTAKATDKAGNTGATSAGFTVTVDLSKPSITISSEKTSPVNTPFEVEISFTEPVYGLSLSDFSLNNGTLSNLTKVDNTTYKATLTPTSDGSVVLSLPDNKATDLAGNYNTASNTLELEYDGTNPQISISSEAGEFVNSAFTVKFTFTEDVTDFDAADVEVSNGSLSAFNKLTSNTYSASITPAADGEVNVRVAADKAFDEAGNGNIASVTFKRTADSQQPTVLLSSAAPDPLNKPFIVTITFSEKVDGLVASDFSVTNGSASQLTKTNELTYTVLITPENSGEVHVALAADKVQDVATNGNKASNELVRTYDSGQPGIVASTSAQLVTNEAFRVTFKLSEPVTDFSLASVSASNADVQDLKQVSELEYTVLISPTKEAVVRIQVPENKVHDAAQNGNSASNVLEVKYDATAPNAYSIEFAFDKIDISNQASVSLKVSRAEEGATYFYSITSSNGGNELTGSAQVTATGFTISGLDVSGLKDGVITATLYLTDEAGNKGTNVTDQVEKITRNVISVEEVAGLKVPFKTDFKSLTLPAQVLVTYANQEQERLTVTWAKGKYNGNKPGVYVLTGELQIPSNASNTDGKTASITVEVEPNKAPTNLSLSNSSFKPNIMSSESIGMFSTTDVDDTEFTYSLVAGQGDADNGLFEINGDELHLKSNSGLYGITKFHIRVQSMDAYQNTIQKEFELTKSPFSPNAKLDFVNAFSPDGDGINDTWTVPELRFFNHVEVEVYDRSGSRVFHTQNPEEGWDGRDKGGKVVYGSFFFIIQVKDTGLVQKGVVTVLK